MLPRFLRFADDTDASFQQPGIATVPGELWGHPTGGDVESVPLPRDLQERVALGAMDRRAAKAARHRAQREAEAAEQRKAAQSAAQTRTAERKEALKQRLAEKKAAKEAAAKKKRKKKAKKKKKKKKKEGEDKPSSEEEEDKEERRDIKREEEEAAQQLAEEAARKAKEEADAALEKRKRREELAAHGWHPPENDWDGHALAMRIPKAAWVAPGGGRLECEQRFWKQFIKEEDLMSQNMTQKQVREMLEKAAQSAAAAEDRLGSTVAARLKAERAARRKAKEDQWDADSDDSDDDDSLATSPAKSAGGSPGFTPDGKKKKLSKREKQKLKEKEQDERVFKAVKADATVTADDMRGEDTRLAVTGANEAHLGRLRGLVAGETQATHDAREMLAHPAPPTEALRARLQRMSAGLTDLKVDRLLSEHPSKPLMLEWIGSFPSRQHLTAYLHEHYDIPLWHCPLLASRLIQMRRSDAEVGVMEGSIAVLQWRHEAAITVAATNELAATVDQTIAAVEEKQRQREGGVDPKSTPLPEVIVKRDAARIKRAAEESQQTAHLRKQRTQAADAVTAARVALQAAQQALARAEAQYQMTEQGILVTSAVIADGEEKLKRARQRESRQMARYRARKSRRRKRMRRKAAHREAWEQQQAERQQAGKAPLPDADRPPTPSDTSSEGTAGDISSSEEREAKALAAATSMGVAGAAGPQRDAVTAGLPLLAGEVDAVPDRALPALIKGGDPETRAPGRHRVAVAVPAAERAGAARLPQGGNAPMIIIPRSPTPVESVSCDIVLVWYLGWCAHVCVYVRVLVLLQEEEEEPEKKGLLKRIGAGIVSGGKALGRSAANGGMFVADTLGEGLDYVGLPGVNDQAALLVSNARKGKAVIGSGARKVTAKAKLTLGKLRRRGGPESESEVEDNTSDDSASDNEVAFLAEEAEKRREWRAKHDPNAKAPLPAPLPAYADAEVVAKIDAMNKHPIDEPESFEAELANLAPGRLKVEHPAYDGMHVATVATRKASAL